MSYHMKYQVYGGMLRPADTWVPRSRRGAMARRRGSTSRACNIAAHAPDHGKHGGQFLRRKARSEVHTSELQSHHDLVCRLLLEKKKMARSAFRSFTSGVIAVRAYRLVR